MSTNLGLTMRSYVQRMRCPTNSAARTALSTSSEGTNYRLMMSADELEREEDIAQLLDSIYRVAGDHDSEIQAVLTDPTSGQHWE